MYINLIKYKKHFHGCIQLSSVEFAKNSELESFETSAFCNSKLEKIIIQSKVSLIKESAFSECRELAEIIFDENSQLQFIGSYEHSISIPSKVKIINDSAF